MSFDTNNLTGIFIITTCLFLVVVVCTVGITLHYTGRRQRERARERSSYEKNLQMARQDMQEATTRQIAAEIHDNVGQRLTVAKLALETLPWQQPALAKSHVAAVVHDMEELFAILRDISDSLHTPMLDSGGLPFAVRQQVKKISRSGRLRGTCSFDDAWPQLSDLEELSLCRIVQEALQNIIKHARANSFSIRGVVQGRHLVLTIADDGRGIPGEGYVPGKGLQNIEDRAALIQARCSIQSTAAGTTLSITLANRGGSHQRH